MTSKLHEKKTFDNIDYSDQSLSKNEFIDCKFTNCDFSKSKLNDTDFINCDFTNCNFSLALLQNTGLKDIRFTKCKLLGIDFSCCNDFLFTVNFQDCILDYSSFFKKKIKNTKFVNCSIKEADFAEVDLSMSMFDNCDLLNASFVRTNLEKTDFRTARNYSIDPEMNRMKNAKFSNLGLAGLLYKYNLDIELT